jgi:hypothetical protein
MRYEEKADLQDSNKARMYEEKKAKINKGEKMKKQYIFWQEVNKQVREECTIEASSLDEATQKHNDGYCDYVEVDALNENEIINEGVDE